MTYADILAKLTADPEFEADKEPWPPTQFSRLRRETGCTAPDELHQMLKDLGPFMVSWDLGFLATWEDGAVSKHSIQMPLLPLKFMLDAYASLRQSTEFPDRFPFDMIFFGSADAGHSKLVMHSAEQADPSVYLWGVTGHPWGTGENARGFGKVAESYFDFVMQLAPIDDL